MESLAEDPFSSKWQGGQAFEMSCNVNLLETKMSPYTAKKKTPMRQMIFLPTTRMMRNNDYVILHLFNNTLFLQVPEYAHMF